MSETTGKKGYLRHDKDGLYWISTIPLEASMDVSDAISDEEGVFHTTGKLADMIKAAKAKGAQEMQNILLGKPLCQATQEGLKCEHVGKYPNLPLPDTDAWNSALDAACKQVELLMSDEEAGDEAEAIIRALMR